MVRDRRAAAAGPERSCRSMPTRTPTNTRMNGQLSPKRATLSAICSSKIRRSSSAGSRWRDRMVPASRMSNTVLSNADSLPCASFSMRSTYCLRNGVRSVWQMMRQPDQSGGSVSIKADSPGRTDIQACSAVSGDLSANMAWGGLVTGFAGQRFSLGPFRDVARPWCASTRSAIIMPNGSARRPALRIRAV